MGKRAMTEETKAAKAQAILDKAAEMLLASEYEKVKMSDIAKAMGISNGILFVYFKTKETLFMSLLMREYEKRLDQLTQMAHNTAINNIKDFKNLVLEELESVADASSLYIRLESMRTIILERNTDIEQMISIKQLLYKRMLEVSSLLCCNGVISKTEVREIFQTESSIITGCMLSAHLPERILRIIDDYHLDGFRRNFKQDTLRTMKRYLDGFEVELTQNIE